MALKAREILTIDPETVIKLLNKAFADEWLAYYQYWIGAQVAEGPLRPSIVQELEEHATQEFDHAKKLSKRIIQLGGTPLMSPQEWLKECNCPYQAPADKFVLSIVEQNIKAEQCAIEVYNTLLKTVKNDDPVTYDLILGILQDELEHEEEMQNLANDINLTIKRK